MGRAFGRAEIGAAWSKQSNEGRDYLGLRWGGRWSAVSSTLPRCSPSAPASPSACWSRAI